MITLVVFTHGRTDYLQQTIKSFGHKALGPITDLVINNDSHDSRFCPDIEFEGYAFKNLRKVHYLESDGAGFAGAIANAWEYLHLGNADNPYIFHLEDDFLFNRQIDLWEMMVILDSHSYMAQLALMRQPCNLEEAKAGSLYELHKGCFTTHVGFSEHDLWFTTNPCMYRRELIREFDWPLEEGSEGKFTIKLREAGYKFGYMGKLDDKPWVTHIGVDRANGKGY